MGSQSDSLMIVAELAVAIAGFAGVVVALRGRAEDLSPLAFARLWRLIEAGLATALFALLPLAFHHLGFREPTVWGTSSALFAVWIVVSTFILFSRGIAQMGLRHVPWGFNAPALIVTGLAVMALVLNALGVGLSRDFGPYFAVLLLNLSLAAAVFARLILARN